MLEGRVLFVDDATLISPAVLAVCYPAMDGRREVTVWFCSCDVIALVRQV
jgi:nitric oxide reductase NorQ protein